MLSSTDAALGQQVVTDPSVPARVRQALDVESGLNDGLAVPFFLVALDLANAELTTGMTGRSSERRRADRLGCRRRRRRAFGGAGSSVSPSAEAGSAASGGRSSHWPPRCWPSAALALGGSGFIVAFVGGMAFGPRRRAAGLA